MAIAGKITNYKLVVGGTAVAQVFTGVEPREIKIIADNAITHIKFTPASSTGPTSLATVNDFLLPNGAEVSFEVGRGLDRISAITTGAAGNIYIAVLES